MAGVRERLRHARGWRHQAVVARLHAILERLRTLDRVEARLDALDAIERRLGALDSLAVIEGRLAGLDARLAALADRVDSELAPALRAVVSEESANRRRLQAARDAPGYAAAFTAAEPLVSVVIPTFRSPATLVERAIPSALAQTHPRIEVVVVSDGPDEETRAAVEGMRDERVRFAATTHRVVDPDPRRHWLVGSYLPRNLGTALARGAWVADLDHDDALRPDAVARLLARARSERAEVVYGPYELWSPDGTSERRGAFPPEYERFHWQGSLVHAGLRFFERELIAAAYGIAGDFFRAQRMLRVGVRFAYEPEVTCDYYPSLLWRSAGGEQGVADPIDLGGAHPGVQREGEQ
jgi:Glycosyl transferase family 2